MSRRYKSKSDGAVCYVAKGNSWRRPFAYSSKADSDFIVALGDVHDTVQEAYDAMMAGQYIKDHKVIEIFEGFIKHGKGGLVIRENFR